MGFRSNSSKLPEYQFPNDYDFLSRYVESRMPKRLQGHIGVSDIIQRAFCVAGIKLMQFWGSTDLGFHGLTFEEAATELSLAVSTCRRRWLEGLEHLSLQLENHG